MQLQGLQLSAKLGGSQIAPAGFAVRREQKWDLPKLKRGNLFAELVSNSQVASFAHWRVWELLPAPCRSSFPEGADESEGAPLFSFSDE
jgi:hypothetical protein